MSSINIINNDKFTERLKLTRKERGYTQVQLAEKMSVSTSFLGIVESGNQKPSYNFIMSLIKVFPDINLNWLLTGEESAPTLPPACPASQSESQVTALRAGMQPPNTAYDTRTLPMIGMAACNVKGWEHSAPTGQRVPWMPRLSEKAFGVMALGESLTPMGLNDGMVCYCDPQYELQGGDIVFIEKDEEDTRVCSLKRFSEFIDISGHAAVSVTGWRERSKGGSAEDFVPEGVRQPGRYESYGLDLDMTTILRLVPVIYVRRKI